MNLRILPLFVILYIQCSPVFSQETNGPKPNSVFVIDSFTINVEGFTRPDAIINKGEFKKGEEIKGLSGLEKYIQEKTQLLINERVLEKVSITYAAGQARDDGKIPIDLIINIKDSWNIIVLPYPRYSSNTGFDLILKARDYNFLGAMNPLRLDVGYKYDEEGRNSLLVELDSNTPFRAFGLNWVFKFVHAFSYRPDTEEPFYYMNTTGLSVELPFKFTTFTIGFDETFILNDENPDSDKLLYGVGDFQSGLYMKSSPYVSWKIPTGVEVGNYGPLVYTPKISAGFSHEFPNWPLSDNRKGPTISFNHNLGFDRINWIGNYRKGVDVSVDNSFNFDFFRLRQEEDPWRATLSFSGTGHFLLTDSFGISARIKYRHWFLSEQGDGEAGDAVRGILNKTVRADYMLSLNLDFPIKVFSFLPSLWLEREKLRLFDFDLHFSPVIDLALYHDPVKEIPFDFKNILVTGGFEFIIFPAFMRSLYLRISLAWNFIEQINNPGIFFFDPLLPIIPSLPSGNNREIFVGIGHHY